MFEEEILLLFQKTLDPVLNEGQKQFLNELIISHRALKVKYESLMEECDRLKSDVCDLIERSEKIVKQGLEKQKEFEMQLEAKIKESELMEKKIEDAEQRIRNQSDQFIHIMGKAFVGCASKDKETQAVFLKNSKILQDKLDVVV